VIEALFFAKACLALTKLEIRDFFGTIDNNV